MKVPGIWEISSSRAPILLCAVIFLRGSATGCLNFRKPARQVEQYTLEYPPPEVAGMPLAQASLKLERFAETAAFNTSAMIYRPEPLKLDAYQYHRWRPRLLALMGALFGLTVITKYFSLILIPEIILTLWLTLRRSDRKPQTANRPKRLNSPLLAFFIGLTLTAGFWLAFILIRFNRVDTLGLIPGLAASLGEPQITEGLVGLLSGQTVRPLAATYSLPDWFSLLYRSFWFEFGWMRIFAPFWVSGLYTVLLLFALAGHTLRFTIYDFGGWRRRIVTLSCSRPTGGWIDASGLDGFQRSAGRTRRSGHS